MNVKVSVLFPSGIGCPGARVDAKILALTPRKGSGMTGTDGSCIVSLNTQGFVGLVNLEFQASTIDSATGVGWSGEVRHRWGLVHIRPGLPGPKREAQVMLSRQPRDISFGLNSQTFTAIQASAEGGLLLYDIEELLECLRSSLPSASLALAGKVLDGSVKIKARADGWWQSAWDRLPLGSLLSEAEVKKRLVSTIGEGGWDRLKGSGVYVRNVGAHQKFVLVSMDEAVASSRVVFDFMVRWWT